MSRLLVEHFSLPALHQSRSWWSDAIRAGPCLGAFQSPVWLAAWAEHFREVSDLRIVTASQRDEVVALLPLALVEDPPGRVVLREAGYPFTDAVRPVGDPSPGIVAALLDHARTGCGGPGPVTLQEVPSGSTLHTTARAQGWTTAPSGPTAEIALASSWEEQAQQFPRHALRRRIAQLQQMAADGVTRFAAGDDEAVAATASLLSLFDTSWRTRGRSAEIGDWQRSRRFRDFMLDVVAGWPEDGLSPFVVGLRQGNRLIAADLLIADKAGRVFMYLTSYDPAYRAYGPGMLAKLESVRFAIEWGADVLDLGRGDEHYKKLLGATFSPLVALSGPEREPEDG